MNENLIKKLKELVSNGSLSEDEYKELVGETEPAEDTNTSEGEKASHGPETSSEETAPEEASEDEGEDVPPSPEASEGDISPEEVPTDEPIEEVPPSEEVPTEEQATPAEPDQTAVLEGRIKDLESTISGLNAKLETIQNLISKLSVPDNEAEEEGPAGLPANSATEKGPSRSYIDNIKAQLGF